MSEPGTAAKITGSNRTIAWLLASLLIGNFLWRTLTEAHEYPGQSAQLLEMTIDALLIAGLFGVRARIPPWLFWIALGLGLFAIRLNGDASWWTGHLMYSLPLR